MYIVYKIRGVMLLQATRRLGLCDCGWGHLCQWCGRGQPWSVARSAYRMSGVHNGGNKLKEM